MMDNARRTGPAVEAQFQFLLWLIPAVERFPRDEISVSSFFCSSSVMRSSVEG
jgi:hypothetical protein